MKLPSAWLKSPEIRAFLNRALREDLGSGDVTSRLTVPPAARARAVLLARESGVAAGLPLFAEVFRRVDPRVRVRLLKRDGQSLSPGAKVAALQGPARALLAGERLALNFLQQLSGVATLTAAYVQEARHGGPAQVLDTRKTVPGMRLLQKYAVVCGGGHNHRLRLDDAILIKDNHIKAAGSVEEAILACKRGAPRLSVECEVETLGELVHALLAGADIVLLDNFARGQLRRAVAEIRAYNRASKRHVLSEASGGVNLKTIRAIAATGVDRISVGALTHSARALDISLEFLRASRV
jgi:nicotinate-nucleotide pyrophosphorylase (carboxylating)